MDNDDLEPRERLAPARALDNLSLDELRTYQERLRRELESVEAVIRDKQADLSAAESLFKT